MPVATTTEPGAPTLREAAARLGVDHTRLSRALRQAGLAESRTGKRTPVSADQMAILREAVKLAAVGVALAAAIRLVQAGYRPSLTSL